MKHELSETYTTEDLLEIAYRGSYNDMERALARQLLTAHEQEPVAVVELSDYVTADQLSGDEPRKKAVKELYDGALVVGQTLYANPAPSIPAAVPEDDADLVKAMAYLRETSLSDKA